MTLVEWAIVIFLFIPLGIMVTAFFVGVAYLQVREEQGR